jgi:hypothetical protein
MFLHNVNVLYWDYWMFLVQLNLFCWLIEAVVIVLLFVVIFNYVQVIFNYFYLTFSLGSTFSYAYFNLNQLSFVFRFQSLHL